jgi:hypothetical protein
MLLLALSILLLVFLIAYTTPYPSDNVTPLFKPENVSGLVVKIVYLTILFNAI